jgi:hypothetical protein
MSSLLFFFPRGKSVLMLPYNNKKKVHQLLLNDNCFPLVSVLMGNFHCHLRGMSTHCSAFNYFNNFHWLFLTFRSSVTQNRKPFYLSSVTQFQQRSIRQIFVDRMHDHATGGHSFTFMIYITYK